MSALKNNPVRIEYTDRLACVLCEEICTSDIVALERWGFKSNPDCPHEGYFVYIGKDNSREHWSDYSDLFYQLVKWCEENNYLWLRIAP